MNCFNQYIPKMLFHIKYHYRAKSIRLSGFRLYREQQGEKSFYFIISLLMIISFHVFKIAMQVLSGIWILLNFFISSFAACFPFFEKEKRKVLIWNCHGLELLLFFPQIQSNLNTRHSSPSSQ